MNALVHSTHPSLHESALEMENLLSRLSAENPGQTAQQSQQQQQGQEDTLRWPIGLEDACNQVYSILQPVVHGGRNAAAILVGLSGAGKTKCLQSVLSRLQTEYHAELRKKYKRELLNRNLPFVAVYVQAATLENDAAVLFEICRQVWDQLAIPSKLPTKASFYVLASLLSRVVLAGSGIYTAPSSSSSGSSFSVLDAKSAKGEEAVSMLTAANPIGPGKRSRSEAASSTHDASEQSTSAKPTEYDAEADAEAEAERIALAFERDTERNRMPFFFIIDGFAEFLTRSNSGAGNVAANTAPLGTVGSSALKAGVTKQSLLYMLCELVQSDIARVALIATATNPGAYNRLEKRTRSRLTMRTISLTHPLSTSKVVATALEKLLTIPLALPLLAEVSDTPLEVSRHIAEYNQAISASLASPSVFQHLLSYGVSAGMSTRWFTLLAHLAFLIAAYVNAKKPNRVQNVTIPAMVLPYEHVARSFSINRKGKFNDDSSVKRVKQDTDAMAIDLDAEEKIPMIELPKVRVWDWWAAYAILRGHATIWQPMRWAAVLADRKREIERHNATGHIEAKLQSIIANQLGNNQKQGDKEADQKRRKSSRMDKVKAKGSDVSTTAANAPGLFTPLLNTPFSPFFTNETLDSSSMIGQALADCSVLELTVVAAMIILERKQIIPYNFEIVWREYSRMLARHTSEATAQKSGTMAPAQAPFAYSKHQLFRAFQSLLRLNLVVPITPVRQSGSEVEGILSEQAAASIALGTHSISATGSTSAASDTSQTNAGAATSVSASSDFAGSSQYLADLDMLTVNAWHKWRSLAQKNSAEGKLVISEPELGQDRRAGSGFVLESEGSPNMVDESNALALSMTALPLPRHALGGPAISVMTVRLALDPDDCAKHITRGTNSAGAAAQTVILNRKQLAMGRDEHSDPATDVMVAAAEICSQSQVPTWLSGWLGDAASTFNM